MKANLKNSEHGKASFDIVIDKKSFNKAKNDAYKKNRNKYSVSGFRKGKVPRQIIEAHYGPNVFFYDAIEELFPEVYAQAVEELELDIMSRPSLISEDYNEDGDVVLSIEVATLPVVTLPDYKEYTFTKDLPEVTDDDVLAELKEQANSYPIKNTEEEVTDDNVVEFSIDSYAVNEETSNLIARDHKLNNGLENSKTIRDEKVLDLLKGKKVGDVISVDYDKDGNITSNPEEIAQHNKLTITEIYVPQEPEINDEFAKSISFAENLEEYKEFLKDILDQEKKQYFIITEYPRLVEKLLDESEVEFSDLYENEVEEEINSQENKLAPFLQFIYEKVDPNKSATENYLNFIRDLSVLEEVADEMGYQITNDDLANELEILSQTSIISTIINQLNPTEARMVLHYSALKRLITNYLAQMAMRNQDQSEAASEEDNK